jgi:hypothetical protein
MRKTAAIVLIILVLVFTGCDPGKYMFSKEELEGNVVKAELIEYENAEWKRFASWVPNHTKDLLPFKTTEASVTKELPEGKMSPFLNRLCKVLILYKYYGVNSPKGKCLRLTYKDGSFLILNYTGISYGYIGRFSEDGKVLEFIGAFEDTSDFQEMIDEFFGDKQTGPDDPRA